MTRLTISTAFITTLLWTANAFSPVSFKTAVSSSTARNVLITEEETEKVMQSAVDCVEGECSIDDVGELVFELKEQQKEMNTRLEEIMNMVAHLQQLNSKEKRKVNEVRAYVKDLLRVFDTSKGGFATGFSGDIGDGPTDAYKALDPKPWKPSN
mmetsp:Transcript_2307/g.2768  ORF Transcript_2307/g.2768 Transcript_2307/m.2768 type:complete len:154 (+) Transcript_2307:37-498(+)